MTLDWRRVGNDIANAPTEELRGIVRRAVAVRVDALTRITGDAITYGARTAERLRNEATDSLYRVTEAARKGDWGYFQDTRI